MTSSLTANESLLGSYFLHLRKDCVCCLNTLFGVTKFFEIFLEKLIKHILRLRQLNGALARNTSRQSPTVALAYDLIFNQIRNLVELQMWLPKRNISMREKHFFFPLHMQDFKCDLCVNK